MLCCFLGRLRVSEPGGRGGQGPYAEGDRMFSLHLEKLFIGKDGYRATKGKMSLDVDYNIFIHMIFN